MIFRAWQDFRQPAFRGHRPLYRILIPILVLLSLGILIQFVLGPALTGNRISEVSAVNQSFMRHLINVVIGLGALYLGFQVKLEHWFKYCGWIVVGGLLASLLAIVVGGAGDVRWLNLGFLSLQPVELLKFAFILTAAGCLHAARNSQRETWMQIMYANRWMLALMSLFGFVVLVLQGDYGSMFVLAVVFMAMFWVSGLAGRFLLIMLALMATVGIFFIVTSPYRMQRLTTFFNPQADCRDSGYQICQALIGIGSGGLTGRGFDSSIQIFGYLPEADNDTVFAGLAELTGFVGATLTLGFFVVFAGFTTQDC